MLSAATEHRVEMLRRRLQGSENRVAWRAEDTARIAAHIGFDDCPSDVAVAVATRAAAPTAVRAVQESDGQTYTFIISTAAVDRMGDTIAVSGWKLEAYRRNPVVLWQHNQGLVPVGRATKVWIEAGALKATMKFAPADASPLAGSVRKLVDERFVRATSVGFMPLKYAFATEPGRKYGIDFIEQELLEFSIVTVPANAEALIEDSSGQSGKSAAARHRARELDLIRIRSGQ
ncbi:HK97 family phage prohead protease [Mesorhizobium helmanticense]|uniref:Prohead serine protease domain-containing protein n=1 Tax=Mesorhizobium helmanticense TaxID=1776423 RepID=A0A2T4IP13_9HYPH|nr:HK97 family phage prohead protease [Mesorhizobium helmanticense]PTE07396.1 hypothetical protein C9427_27235 [Mesorhizobium helmanticense]